MYESVVKELKGLPEENIIDVVKYIQFLKFKLPSEQDNDKSTETRKYPERKLGIFKGKFVMSEDFDETPDCLKEYVGWCIYLDTHALLWLLSDEKMLSQNARQTILGDNGIFVSIVSLWEIAIKQCIGKLEIDESIQNIVEACEKNGIELLSITPAHLDCIKELPLVHGDSFDRLLISQAVTERLVIITK